MYADSRNGSKVWWGFLFFYFFQNTRKMWFEQKLSMDSQSYPQFVSENVLSQHIRFVRNHVKIAVNYVDGFRISE